MTRKTDTKVLTDGMEATARALMGADEVTQAEAVEALGKMRKATQRAYKRVGLMRSWRPSEKACTRADLATDESALLVAMRTLQAVEAVVPQLRAQYTQLVAQGMSDDRAAFLELLMRQLLLDPGVPAANIAVTPVDWGAAPTKCTVPGCTHVGPHCTFPRCPDSLRND